ncbi:MAG: DNA recombination protein RmuC, partial [Mucispirillum sp.]|nr:DNA recombination protein RmuC [Mucispirillum sp.]
MNNPYILISIAFIIGVFFGAVVVLIIFKILSAKSENRFNAVLNQAAESMKSSFAEISLETIGKTTGIMSETLKSEREVSAKEIAGQKEVIEKRIEVLNGELAKLTALIGSVENSRNMQMGELKSIIDDSRLKTGELMKVTSGLRETLSSKQDRGQWAERMADDILNYAGLKEGINYVRQQKSGATGKRPDFTFMLPNGMLLNMDVKFPYDN